MPEQNPISIIISKSYSVRIRMRWASSSFFCFSSSAIRSPNSSRIVLEARFMFSIGVTNCLPGKIITPGKDSSMFPVNGSKRVIRSISSPKNSIRMPSSSSAGRTSTVSPRTRKCPRSNWMSFRSYWISTNRESSRSRPNSSPMPRRMTMSSKSRFSPTP